MGAIACHNSGETEEVVELTQNDNFLLNLFVSFLLCAAASLLPPPGYCVCGLRRRSTMSENYTLDIQQSIGGTLSEAAAG